MPGIVDIAKTLNRKHANINASQMKAVVADVFETVEDIIIHTPKSTSVRVGIGTFYKKSCPEKKGRNPRTGEPIIIPAQVRLKFKPRKK